MTSLGWDEVAERFGAAKNWWVATTGAGGPHSVPVWGVVADSALYFYGEPTAVRSRNLALDPRLVLHLESGSSVLILHGRAHVLGPAASSAAVSAAYAEKYTDPSDLDYLPDAPAMAGVQVYAVEPLRAITWQLGGSAEWVNRRWRADAADA